MNIDVPLRHGVFLSIGLTVGGTVLPNEYL